MTTDKKLAQPEEKATTPAKWILCPTHFGVHRERETCYTFKAHLKAFYPEEYATRFGKE